MRVNSRAAASQGVLQISVAYHLGYNRSGSHHHQLLATAKIRYVPLDFDLVVLGNSGSISTSLYEPVPLLSTRSDASTSNSPLLAVWPVSAGYRLFLSSRQCL